MTSNNLETNLKTRIELNQKCEESELSRTATILAFEKDITLFFDMMLWTYDPRKKPKDRPFLLWDYQRELVIKVNQRIVDGESLLVEKSRDMGVTWVILGVFFYRWLVLGDNFLVGSRKEELVDKIGNIETLFERLRYMMRNLPLWIKQYYGISEKNFAYMKLFKSDGSSIVGESMNENFSRQGRYNAILLDEFAFVEGAENIWRACGDSAPCKIPVSTPKGKHNMFARLRQSGKIAVETLHWNKHPEKDDTWYKKQQNERSEKDVAQELDINYTVSAGSPFYRGFIRGLHSKPLFLSTKELILGFDYGYHHPACVFTFIDAKGRWILYDCLFGEDELISEFGNKVRSFLNKHYRDIPITCYGDPAGNQESDKSKKSSVEILSDMGFEVTSRPSNTSQANYDARKKIVEGKLKRLIDGNPELMVNDNERTQILIEAFEGGWHYPEANRHGFIEERPVREGHYEHVMNAMDYVAVNIFSPVPQKQEGSGKVIVKVAGDLKDIRIEVDEGESNRGRYMQTTRGME